MNPNQINVELKLNLILNAESRLSNLFCTDSTYTHSSKDKIRIPLLTLSRKLALVATFEKTFKGTKIMFMSLFVFTI